MEIKAKIKYRQADIAFEIEKQKAEAAIKSSVNAARVSYTLAASRYDAEQLVMQRKR